MSSSIVYIHRGNDSSSYSLNIKIDNHVNVIKDSKTFFSDNLIRIMLEYIYDDYKQFMIGSMSTELFKWCRAMLPNQEIPWEQVYVEYCRLGNIDNIINLEKTGFIKLNDCVISAMNAACGYNQPGILEHVLGKRLLVGYDLPTNLIRYVCELGYIEILQILDRHFTITRYQRMSVSDKIGLVPNLPLIEAWLSEGITIRYFVCHNFDRHKCCTWIFVILIILISIGASLLAVAYK